MDVDYNEFYSQHLEAIMKVSDQRITGILINAPNKALPDAKFGSATCFTVLDRFFLITAGHNLEKVPLDLLRIFSREKPSRGRIKILGANYIAEPARADAVDVGWVELDAESAYASGLVPITVDDLMPFHDLIGDIEYLLSGLPFERHEKNFPDFILNPYHLYVDPKKDAEPSDVDLAFYYPETGQGKNGQVVTPYPGGISGGPIWYFDVSEPNGIWRPELKLVGIFRSFDKARREGYGVKIHHWLKLLNDDFPELRKEIEPLLKSQ